MKSTKPVLASLTLAVLSVFVMTGCSRELHHGLGEAEANEMVSVLSSAGIRVAKERDPQSKGRWMVSVASGDAPRALLVLDGEGLPRRTSQTFADLYPRSGLIPSRSEEQVLLQTATAGKLEESLRSLDGVVDARVHLVLPPRGPLGASRGPDRAAPKASVLVKLRRGVSADLDKLTVAELVAYGAPELQVDQVDVVMVAAPPAPVADRSPPKWASLGPWRVAPESKGPLQVGLLLLVLGILALSGGLGYQTFKLWRLRTRRACAPDPS